jgi:integrase/recombinase XerD
MSTTSTAELVPGDVLINPVRIAVAGFLAGSSGRTRQAYSLDLRQWSRWCADQHLEPFGVARAPIELYARWLEETGRALATIG